MSVDESALQRALGSMLEFAGDRATASRGDLLARMDALLSTAVVVLSVDSVGLMLLDEADRARFAAATDDSARLLEIAQTEYDEGPGIDTLRTGGTVVVDDAAAWRRYPRLWARLAESQVGAVLSSPVRVEQAVLGNFNAVSRTLRPWTPEQIRANDAYAGVIGQALRLSAQETAADGTIRRLQQQVDLSDPPEKTGPGQQRGGTP